MRINANTLSVKSQDDADRQVNNLLVSLQRFSEIACIDGHGYGVHVDCESCGDPVLNPCLRKHIVRELISAHQIAEKRVRYSLTPRYYTERIPWNGSERIHLKPGVSKVNVALSYSNAIAFPVNFFAVEDATLTDTGSGFWTVSFDAAMIPNPAHAIVEDVVGNTYPTQNRSGYPNLVGGEWVIPLGNTVKSDPGFQMNIRHCRMVYVDALIDDCEGEIVPTYPNSTQEIPYVSKEVIAGGYRFWFYTWTLLGDAFAEDGADLSLSGREYWKLLQTVDFRCKKEVESGFILEYEQHDATMKEVLMSEGTHTLSIHSSYEALVDVKKALATCVTGTPRYITISYKTDPDEIPFSLAQAETISTAIAYLAASKLPLDMCNCDPDRESFIGKAHRHYSEIRVNPITGENIQNLKHGETYGQLRFEELIGQVTKYHQFIRA